MTPGETQIKHKPITPGQSQINHRPMAPGESQIKTSQCQDNYQSNVNL